MCKKEDLKGGTPEQNAEITRDILSGAKGIRRDVVVLNAGAGFYAAEAAESIADGIKKAQSLIDSGAALKKLDEFIAESNDNTR